MIDRQTDRQKPAAFRNTCCGPSTVGMDRKPLKKIKVKKARDVVKRENVVASCECSGHIPSHTPLSKCTEMAEGRDLPAHCC